MPSPFLGEADRRSHPVVPTVAPSHFPDLLDSRFYLGGLDSFAMHLVVDAEAHRPRIAVGVNAHLVNQMAGDGTFAADLAQVDTLYADGQSVVWGGRVLDVPIMERIATTDLAPAVIERAARRGLSVYLLGGRPGVADDAAAVMRRHYPGARIRAHHGYFQPGSPIEDDVLLDIAGWGTEILFIGMGDPLQLRWAMRNRAALGTATVLTSGGLFDWLSGRNVRAPRLLITLGLEWLWRLMIEPKRLWRRYVVGNPAFVLRVVGSLLGRRRVVARSRSTEPASDALADAVPVRASDRWT